VRGSRWAFALRGLFADRALVLSAFLVVLLAASLVAAIPIYANAVAQSTLRERLQRAPTTQANLQATVPVFDGAPDPSVDRRVQEIVRDAFSAATVAIYRSAESEPFSIRGKIAVFGFFDGVDRHARLLAGRWPASRGAAVEVVVPAPTARELRLRLGDLVSARSRLDGNNVVTARVVGVYRVERPTSTYWWGRPLAEGGAQGPLVTTRRSFVGLDLQAAELRWRLEPDFRRLTIDQATGLRQKLEQMPRRLNAGRPSGQQFLLETDLPQILGAAAQSLTLARAGVLVPSIQLALLAAYGLLITAVLLTERRRLRAESLRLRGATTVQLVTIALGEAILITLPAVAAAPWVAAGVLHAVNVIGPLAEIGMRLEPHVSLAAYALAGAAGAVCVAGLVLPALTVRGAAVSGDRGRLPLAGFAQRVRLDLALVVLALLGYWQLRRYHGVLLSNRGSLAIDPFLVAAPALLLLGGGLLSLRVVPLAAGFVERLLTSTRGAVTALGLWQLARRPGGYARSVLLLVLAIAIGVFAAAYSRTWHQSQIDQARYSAGADLLVEPSQVGGAPPSIALASAYRALGVEDAHPVARETFSLDRFGETSASLLALDVGRAETALETRPDFASRPFGELLRPLSAGRGSVASLPLPGRPTRLALSVRLASMATRPAPAQAPPGAGTLRASPSLFLYLRDGEGILYAYRLGDLPPGRDSRFALDLSHRLTSGRPALPRYPLALIGLELVSGVPDFVARRLVLSVRRLEVAAGTQAEWSRVPLGRQARWRASASSFELMYESPRIARVSAADGTVRATLSTGSLYASGGGPPSSIEFHLRPGVDSLPRATRVLVSESFLAATHMEVGDLVPLALGGGTQTVRITGTYRRFPTLDPALPSVIVDLPTYVTLSFSRHGAVVQPSQWWLETARAREVAEQLRAAPYRSLGVVSRSESEQALLEDPAPLGVIGALTLGFVVAAAFAVIGYGASATASARSRALEFAVLRTLGLRTGQLSGWIGLESALVVGLSLLTGTALGLIVAWLVLPYVALGPSGEVPVPPVRLIVPWATMFWLDLAVLGALVAIAAAQVAYIRRLRPAPVLRGGEGAVAR
jgi:hypothetical protein